MQSIYKEIGDTTIIYAWFEAMHTRIDLILCNKRESEMKRLALLVGEELSRIEKVGNRFDPCSELGAVNRLASSKPLIISPELFGIVSECLSYHDTTCGCFDITVNSPDYVESLVPYIEMNSASSEIFFKNRNVKIDLNGYLKGYALEKTKSIFEGNGVDDAFVSLGNSSIYACGNQPNGKGWKVAAADDRPAVTLNNECLTTSGNETGERRHIKSPETGLFVEGTRNLSVVTKEGTAGEVLSTALFVADPEKRERILKAFPVSCRIVFDTPPRHS